MFPNHVIEEGFAELFFYKLRLVCWQNIAVRSAQVNNSQFVVFPWDRDWYIIENN